MAGEKEIRGQIRSIQNTQKITKAMEMVAASKIRRAQEAMAGGRPYADHIRQVAGHIAKAHAAFDHPFLEEREETSRVGMIVVSSDRGLCGGLNVNLFKKVLGEVKDRADRGIKTDFCAFGQKGIGFIRRVNGNLLAQAAYLGDKPRVADAIGPMKVMLDAYKAGELDAIWLLGNRFVNSMVQQPYAKRLLPLEPIEESGMPGYWDYVYEPDEPGLLEAVLTRYLEMEVYQALLENVACEMAARMVAMKSASDNAGELIDDLQLAYNKARQAAITQELAEIVGGAAAV